MYIVYIYFVVSEKVWKKKSLCQNSNLSVHDVQADQL